MRPHPDCVPCLLKRVLFQARLLDNDRDFDAVRAALKAYAEKIDTADNSAKLATAVHRSAYDAMGVEDPYLELKVRADEIASRYMEKLENFVDSSEDRFAAAVRVSIIGNVMDFGSGIAIDDPDEFEGEFDSLLEQGIASDETQLLRAFVDSSSTVIYFFDNCGEDQFDKILIREIRKMGKRVVGVVRGKAILNDVTQSDAERIGLDNELDRLLTSNAFSIGVDMSKIGDDLKKEISNAGIIISKGMANYESLSDEDLCIPIAHLMKAKCIPVAKSLGVSVGDNVVRIQT
jgi:damage-control phosphatase, subfamily I